MTITIDDKLFARLQVEAAKRGQDVDLYASTVLEESIVLGDEAVLRLTDADNAAIQAGVQRGLDDFAANRFRPFAEYVRDATARYGLSD